LTVDQAQLEKWKQEKKLSGFVIDPNSGDAAAEAQALAGLGSPTLIDDIRQLAKNAGLAETPLIFISSDNQMNARASALRDQYIIAIHQSMFKETTPEELRGIISHELAHIALGHVVFDTPQPPTLLSRILESKAGALARAPFQLWLSRYTEKAADMAGVIIAGGGEGLISYLNKISDPPTALERLSDKLQTPFSDHPRFEKRIAFLKKFAAEHAAEISATHSQLDQWRGKLAADFSQAVVQPVAPAAKSALKKAPQPQMR
jgi:Zn-dependent protease with chaperone function